MADPRTGSNRPKVIVVMPAYNAAKTLEQTYREVPKDFVDEVILVDDGSHDATAKVAGELGLTTFVHKQNLGYGRNQKTCYREALRRGADIVIMLHPDYQYSPNLIVSLAGMIAFGEYDVALASRILGVGALKGGMPLYKYIANRFLTVIENLFMGQNLGEWHSGLRAYTRRVLETLPWERNSNDFVFDCEFLVQASAAGFRLGDIPAPARYFEEASSINFFRSVRYGLASLTSILRYYLHRAHLWKCPLFEPK